MSMSEYYILDGHNIVEADLHTWAKWIEKNRESKRVARTEVGDVDISTVFLGLNHGYGEGPPVLFETMIFGGMHDEDQWRYCTWDEAVVGHEKAVTKVRKALLYE